MAATAPGYANCVGLWKMNDNLPTTDVIDSSGQGNHGMANKNTDLLDTMGKVNGALHFTDSDIVNCGNDGSLQINTNSLSVVCWVKDPARDNDLPIAVIKYDGSNVGWYVAAYVGGANDNKVLWKPSGSGLIASGVDLDDGSWHLIIVAQSGTSAKLYVDGVHRGTYTSCWENVSTVVDLFIGGSASGADRYEGDIDIVMVFNKALSDDEALWLWNGGAGKELCSLNPILHHYKQLVGV